MTIELNHTIVRVKDKFAAAEFYSRILGCENKGEVFHFVVVKINESLSFDFDNSEGFQSQHYAFKVSDEKFDEVFKRIKTEAIIYGSGPRSLEDMKFNDYSGGRGFYFRDLDGHILELLTQD